MDISNQKNMVTYSSIHTAHLLSTHYFAFITRTHNNTKLYWYTKPYTVYRTVLTDFNLTSTVTPDGILF